MSETKRCKWIQNADQTLVFPSKKGAKTSFSDKILVSMRISLLQYKENGCIVLSYDKNSVRVTF